MENGVDCYSSLAFLGMVKRKDDGWLDMPKL